MHNLIFNDTQIVAQLDSRQGGYCYLEIPASLINSLEKGRKSRFICTLNDSVKFQCGLSHLGNGNFFIILSKDRRKQANIEIGDRVSFHLRIDPNPLGVAIPEMLEVLLSQDNGLNAMWNELTDGKKRSVIYAVNRIKNVDLQVRRSIELIQKAHS